MFEKPTRIWIIDDEEVNRTEHKLLFFENCPNIQVIDFECLQDAFKCDLDADYIFIDLSAVDGRTLSCFNNHLYIKNLQHFVEKHCSSFIIIMGALISHAEEDVKDLQDACPDVKLFALDSCDLKNPNALTKFVNKYSYTVNKE